jgi:hypothetical protein
MEIENKFQQSDDHIQPAKNEPSDEEEYTAFIYIVYSVKIYLFHDGTFCLCFGKA